MTRAARAFCAVARMAWPNRELLRKRTSTPPVKRAAPNATSLMRAMVIAPLSTPSSSSWTGSSGASKSSRRLSICSLRQLARPDRLRFRPLARRDHFVGPVQHLVEHHLLGDVLARRVELDGGEHGHQIG